MRIKKETIKRIAFFIAIYIVCFAFYLATTTEGKNAAGISGNKSVGVAKWDVSATGNDNEVMNMIIGDNASYKNYTLTVTSTSEVSSSYSVKISDVPDGLQVQVDDGTIYDEEDNVILINNVGTFSANDINSTHTHKLTFIVPLGIDEIDNQEINLDVILSQTQ